MGERDHIRGRNVTLDQLTEPVGIRLVQVPERVGVGEEVMERLIIDPDRRFPALDRDVLDGSH